MSAEEVVHEDAPFAEFDPEVFERGLAAADEERRKRWENPNYLASAALWYANRGFMIFPLRPFAKIPYGKTKGVLDASNDPDKVAYWWSKAPQSNIGIATGHLVDVIDIDGELGHQSRLNNWDLFKSLDVIAVVSTPRAGGQHIYVKAHGGGNRAGVWPGIDIRGKGGYVILPPSRLKEGVQGNKYSGSYDWIVPLMREDRTAEVARPLCENCLFPLDGASILLRLSTCTTCELKELASEQ